MHLRDNVSHVLIIKVTNSKHPPVFRTYPLSYLFIFASQMENWGLDNLSLLISSQAGFVYPKVSGFPIHWKEWSKFLLDSHRAELERIWKLAPSNSFIYTQRHWEQDRHNGFSWVKLLIGISSGLFSLLMAMHLARVEVAKEGCENISNLWCCNFKACHSNGAHLLDDANLPLPHPGTHAHTKSPC